MGYYTTGMAKLNPIKEPEIPTLTQKSVALTDPMWEFLFSMRGILSRKEHRGISVGEVLRRIVASEMERTSGKT